MDCRELKRAIRYLRRQQSRNRLTAFTLTFGGLIVVASGIWAQYRISEQIGKTIERFYDTPAVAIGMVSAVNPTITIARLAVFVGIGFALFGIIRVFHPDPTRTVLLALLEQSNLDGIDEPDTLGSAQI